MASGRTQPEEVRLSDLPFLSVITNTFSEACVSVERERYWVREKNKEGRGKGGR